MMFKIIFYLTILSAAVSLSLYFSIKAPSNQENIRIITSPCSLNMTSCSIDVSDTLVLNFELIQKNLPSLEPLQVFIRGETLDASSIKLWLEGRDMNMGKHYLIPVSNENKNAGKSMEFKGMIPVCSVDAKMIWRLMAEVFHQKEWVKIQFDLQTTASLSDGMRRDYAT